MGITSLAGVAKCLEHLHGDTPPPVVGEATEGAAQTPAGALAGKAGRDASGAKSLKVCGIAAGASLGREGFSLVGR